MFHNGFPVLMCLASAATTKFNPPKHKAALEISLDLLPPVLVGDW